MVGSIDPATVLKAHRKILGKVKASYAAGKPSKHKRVRKGQGGSADAHTAIEYEFWKAREDARSMDRDDWAFGQLVDRAVTNINKNGQTPDPKTKDKGLNNEISERWKDWSDNPFECDLSERFTFPELSRLMLRASFVDGDSFALPIDNGRLQIKESCQIASPNGQDQNSDIVHGVEVDPYSKPLAYWIQKPGKGERQRPGRRMKRGKKNFVRKKSKDKDGFPNVLHTYDPKRYTQSRGITAFKAVFDISSMIEDTAFAKLIQEQIASCIALFIKGDGDKRIGSRYNETDGDGVESQIEEITPGLILRGNAGESIEGFSPGVVSKEWFELLKFFLRVFGAQIGMPLTLVLLDTSNTTFHGYRGELQQARLGFEWVQKWMQNRFLRHVYRWKLREWFPKRFGKGGKKRRLLLKHEWTAPGWPYVDPLNDVKADSMALQNGLISPRRVVARRGLKWETLVEENTQDRTLATIAAIKASQKIYKETGVVVPWRELSHLAPPQGLNITGEQVREQKEISGEETEETENKDSSEETKESKDEE